MSFLSEKEFLCPYCGSCNQISLDYGQGKQYELVTDCEICCRPIIIYVRIIDNDYAVDARAENE
jgi:hypothetical protein